jgi:hypothetical protein
VRSLLLTFALYRVELAFALVLAGLLALSTLVVTSHIHAATVPPACADAFYAANGVDTLEPACRSAVYGFWSAREESEFLAGTAALAFPWLIGLVLGVPIVGRELETGTASLAWSLTGGRASWLAARLLPLLVIAVLVALVVGMLLARMTTAAAALDAIPGPERFRELDDLGADGILVMTRTVAAFGVGLLCGAFIGRSSIAAIVGVVLAFVLFIALGAGLQWAVSEQLAIWRPAPADDEGPPTSIRLVDHGWADEAGMVSDRSELVEYWRREVCPGCGHPDDPGRAGEIASDRFRDWLRAHYTQWVRVVPREAYGDFERTEAAAGLLVGLGAILLAFPLVSWRRPR